MQLRFAALDTKFILALGGGEPDAESTIDFLTSNGFFPIVTESVMEQLGELCQTASGLVLENAKYSAKWLTTWNILDLPNANTSNGTSQINAEKILEQGLIPNATQIEAEMLVEAACHNCEFLITFSDALLTANQAELNLALVESDLEKVTVIIASPTQISERIRRSKSHT